MFLLWRCVLLIITFKRLGCVQHRSLLNISAYQVRNSLKTPGRPKLQIFEYQDMIIDLYYHSV